MKIKLISLILILSCLVSVSGYAEQEEIVEFSNEEITERHIQEHPYIAKVKLRDKK
ncbi:MAG: hypothetical protein LBQ04_02195 [Endomicrobium sp.]|jgi:hypothetical protein|nr:hypothetical protein [Endomicrobium sp.]